MKKYFFVALWWFLKSMLAFSQCETKFIKNPGKASGDIEIEFNDCKDEDYNGNFRGYSTFISDDDFIFNGKFVGNNGNIVFEGVFFDAKKNNNCFADGQIKHYLASSDGSKLLYTGSFKESARNGWGVVTCLTGQLTGTSYTGYWRAGLPEKYGKLKIFMQESSKKTKDNFEEDMNNYFTFVARYSQNGDIYDGEWGYTGNYANGLRKISYKGYGIYYSSGKEPVSGIWLGSDSIVSVPEIQVIEYLNKKYKLNLKPSEDPIIKENEKVSQIAKLEKNRINTIENQSNLTGSIKTDVKAEIVEEPDERGNIRKNLRITWLYDVIKAKIEKQTNDYGGGEYKLSSSKAASMIMQEFKNGCETNDSLNSYLRPGIRVDFKITGSTDGTLITKVLPYTEDYGAFNSFECFINNNFGSVSVNRSTGIKTNDQLALLRCAGVRDFIEKYVSPLKNTINNYQYYLVNYSEKGDSLRRISIEMTIYDPFSKPKIEEVAEISDIDTVKFKPVYVNTDAIAVVIGNGNYGKNADYRKYGINDAISVKNYLVGMCGFKEGNVNLRTDATLNEMRTIFGTEDGPDGWLNDHSNEKTDVFIYFSGHGAPGMKNNKCYLMPVDCNPNYAQSSGYSLDLLYQNLSLIKAKNIFVVIDACFSEQILQNVSPLRFKRIEPVNAIPNGLVITASDSYAMDYPDGRHTMLTYFFLKAMKDGYNSDISPKDGRISIQEIFNYISDLKTGVPKISDIISDHHHSQVPHIQGSGDKERVFAKVKK